MKKLDIIRMAREADIEFQCNIGLLGRETISTRGSQSLARIERLVALAMAAEREACEALHDHEAVMAPIGNSAWGEAYQDGWGQGTAAYREAIRARGQA